MPTYGGYAPQPERYGGGKPRVQHVHEALLHSSDFEVGLDVSEGSYAWIEDLAIARAIDSEWSTNRRGANEFDPRRTQSMLPRWEKFCSIVPLDTDTPAARRARLVKRFSSFGVDPVPQQFLDDLGEILGAAFVGFFTVSDADTVAYYPGSAHANPYTSDGATVEGVSLVDWWTSQSHYLLLVSKPSGMSGSAYESLEGEASAYLDSCLQGWCTFSVGEYAHGGGAGFFLDEANLDLEPLGI